MFIYKDKVFQQIGGVAMGSPLGPTMASYFPRKPWNSISSIDFKCSPKLYYRYANDIFAVFDKECDCAEFLNLLNSQHKNIKCTMEKPFGTLSFLDIDLKIKDGNSDSWIWKKSTNTDVFLNFKAICSFNWICDLYTFRTINTNVSYRISQYQDVFKNCNLFAKSVY